MGIYFSSLCVPGTVGRKKPFDLVDILPEVLSQGELEMKDGSSCSKGRAELMGSNRTGCSNSVIFSPHTQISVIMAAERLGGSMLIKTDQTRQPLDFQLFVPSPPTDI